MDSKIIVKWHNPEQTILFLKAEIDWTWDEMDHAVAKGKTLLDTVEHSVYTIVDFSEAHRTPLHVLTNLKNMNLEAHPNQTKLAIVGVNVAGKSMINIFIRLYGTLVRGVDTKLVPTIEDAYQFFDIDTDST